MLAAIVNDGVDSLEDFKVSIRKSAVIPDPFNDAIVCRGFLLKKNRYFQKQLRYFHLHKNGELKYYKDVKVY